jgi:hypothetical protein
MEDEALLEYVYCEYIANNYEILTFCERLSGHYSVCVY